ncbi:subclass B1 metallo-beta-lactamase [Hymenobacter sp. BT186]|uniref:beta-lactamase n=1 Tax=Hymenobacter telluris TaxID=2816474 RepID=A0A939JC19_9BACT|nr:subclass B1 metallo-beta-lactamase [Hymenobacter telluris]MBO0356862.1 subclass B1 metallo-beta-lactamase [Hymenobacter telluris]MBW3372888.1 subclass B1 metallo-beta-lactamase [Hymenobacter norwichensis]
MPAFFFRLPVRPRLRLVALLFFLPTWLLANPVAGTKPTALHLRVRPVAPGVFVHTSYHRYPGNPTPIPSNGLIISTKTGALVVDTAWDPDQTMELLHWVADSLHQHVRLVIVTHAHEDRLGGLAVVQANHIKVYSTPLTAKRAARLPFGVPTPAIKPFTVIRAGRTRLELFYPGPGHAPDNLVAWLPQQRVLFGGCLVKGADATTLGNIDDADLKQWPVAVRTVAARYPKAAVVVPGHGTWGGTELLEHTLNLLQVPGRKPQTALNGQP